jgi:flavin-binding protein dodecin
MSVVKVIRLVGSSRQSWTKAAQAAVQEAARTIRGIQGVEATDFTGKVDDSGRITEYRCTVNIAFLVGGQGAGGEAGARSGRPGAGRSGGRGR